MRASAQLVVLVVRLELARRRRCVEGYQVDLGTFEAHRSIAYRVYSGVTSRHKSLLLVLPLWGLLRASTARQVHTRSPVKEW